MCLPRPAAAHVQAFEQRVGRRRRASAPVGEQIELVCDERGAHLADARGAVAWLFGESRLGVGMGGGLGVGMGGGLGVGVGRWSRG